MALTRSMLKGMGITDEQMTAIIDAHTESTDALKAQRDEYKAQAESNAEAKKELDALKASGSDWQAKYEKEHNDFETFKKDVTAKASAAAKESAFSKLLKELGINDKRAASIMKVTDLSAIEMNDDGTIKDASKVTESVKTEWAEFIPTQEEQGAKTKTPPGTNNNNVDLGTLSMEEYIKARNKK